MSSAKAFNLDKSNIFVVWLGDKPCLTNKVRNKETHEYMHGRNIRFGWDLNQ